MNNNNTEILKVSGKNLDIFFQNLITNDINYLKKQKSVYACILSPQGKFLNDFFIIEKDKSFYIEINKSEIDEFSNILKKYDLRKTLDIKIQHKLQTIVLLEKDFMHMSKKFQNKKEKEEALFETFSDPRADNFFVRCWINKIFLSRCKYFLEDNYKKKIEIERIKRHIPNSEIDLEKNKSFILNYGFDSINAISFDKGCYVGQENTARQKYRGTKKYSMKLLKRIDGDFPDFNSELRYLDKKIGIMKSSRGDFGLALIKNDILNKNKEYQVSSLKFLVS